MEESDRESEESFELVSGRSSESSPSENGDSNDAHEQKVESPDGKQAEAEERLRKEIEEKDETIRLLRVYMKELEEERTEALNELEIMKISALAEREEVILEKTMRIYELEDRISRLFGRDNIHSVRNAQPNAEPQEPRNPADRLKSYFFNAFHIQTVGFISIFTDLVLSSSFASRYLEMYPMLLLGLMTPYWFICIMSILECNSIVGRTTLYFYVCILISRILVTFGLIFYTDPSLGGFWLPFTCIQAYIALAFARYVNMLDPEILRRMDEMTERGWIMAQLISTT